MGQFQCPLARHTSSSNSMDTSLVSCRPASGPWPSCSSVRRRSACTSADAKSRRVGPVPESGHGTDAFQSQFLVEPIARRSACRTTHSMPSRLAWSRAAPHGLPPQPRAPHNETSTSLGQTTMTPPNMSFLGASLVWSLGCLVSVSARSLRRCASMAFTTDRFRPRCSDASA